MDLPIRLFQAEYTDTLQYTLPGGGWLVSRPFYDKPKVDPAPMSTFWLYECCSWVSKIVSSPGLVLICYNGLFRLSLAQNWQFPESFVQLPTRADLWHPWSHNVWAIHDLKYESYGRNPSACSKMHRPAQGKQIRIHCGYYLKDYSYLTEIMTRWVGIQNYQTVYLVSLRVNHESVNVHWGIPL